MGNILIIYGNNFWVQAVERMASAVALHFIRL
jgi:hypothetical protein